MAQILTYPYETKYQLSGWADQVKNGKYGSISCSNGIYKGTSKQSTGGFEWYVDGNGQDNTSDAQRNYLLWDQSQSGKSQKGLHFWANTSTNYFATARWWDIGAEANKTSGTSCSSSAKSSWTKEVTSIWFLFNSHDTTTSRGCYAGVEKVAIRYRDPNGEIKFMIPSVDIGSLPMGQGHRGDKVVFGYKLSSSECNTVCNGDYHLLGCRVQIRLWRDGKGNNTDTMQGGITGLRFGLGRNYIDWNTTKKRALIGRGDRTWSDFNSSSRYELETR